MDNENFNVGVTRTFKTVDSRLRQHNGSTVQVEKVYDKPDDRHDEEVLPMYDVRITSDTNKGELLHTFHDELV